MEWTREKTLMLIEEYQKRRGLWDMTHEDYRKKNVKRQLLNEVAEKINVGLPISSIEKKFHTLRTQYHREVNRMKVCSGEDFKSKWFAFRHLQFLSSPKACRGFKSENKLEKSISIKKESSLPATYIIKQIQQEQNDGLMIEENNDNHRIIQDPHTTTATEYLTIQNKNLGRNCDSRKDYEKLIQETTKDVEEIDDGMEHTQNIHTIEHYIEDQEDDQIPTQQDTITDTIVHHDDTEHQAQMGGQIIRIQKRDVSAIEKIYEEPLENKKIKMCGGRDEFAIYGEYVANEMRMITSREVLINLKHKINLALFEANMAQLNKDHMYKN